MTCNVFQQFIKDKVLPLSCNIFFLSTQKPLLKSFNKCQITAVDDEILSIKYRCMVSCNPFNMTPNFEERELKISYKAIKKIVL